MVWLTATVLFGDARSREVVSPRDRILITASVPARVALDNGLT
ncbi:hypothetical protein [Streptomyces sp. NPDC057199]